MSVPNLPALIVVLPLLAGITCGLLGRGGRAWLLTLVTTWVTFGLTVVLALDVDRALSGPDAADAITYAVGGWGASSELGLRIGIDLVVDRLNALVLMVVALIGAAVAPATLKTFGQDVPEDRRHFAYAAYLLCLTGLLGITITGDAFNLYVLLEISSLTTYALVALGRTRDRRALTASFRYLVMGTVGASFILLGVGYLLMATGTLNMGDLQVRVATLQDDRTVHTAFALIVAGLAVKMALVPVHNWLPAAYAHAPATVSAFLSSTATKVGVYATLRLVFGVFGAHFAFTRLPTGTILLACGCAAMLYGSLRALSQRDLKFLLAYSSVAQIGYMVVGIGLANLDGLTGTLAHLTNHALVKCALFLGTAGVVYRCGGSDLERLQGLAKRMPMTSIVLIGALLGLIGVPLTGGFISKWYLVGGALRQGAYVVAGITLFSSLLAVAYSMRVIERIYFGTPTDDTPKGEAHWTIWLPALVLVAGSLWLGVDGRLTGHFGRAAAAALLGGAP